MSQLLQENRPGEFNSPLGKDKLSLTRFDGSEGIGELFEYRVEAVSSQDNIDFDSALGHNCCVTLKTKSGPDRHFNGVLVEAQWVGSTEDLFIYRMVLRPWLWLLSRTSDCRIWRDENALDALDIIKQVFRDRGFTDFRDSTTSGFPTQEYCVQYRETDFNFVSRLMEKHGIYYFFEHSQDRHLLVLADSKSSHKPVPGHAATPFFGAAQTRRDQENFSRWTAERRFRTGKYDLNDYDFKKPGKNLDVNKLAGSKYNKGQLEIYDYPGAYIEQSNGETFAKVRLDADQAQDRRRHATGNAISLFPGGLTKLERHPTAAENVEYLVLRASHSYVAQHYRSKGEGEDDYSGAYELLDSSIPYRSPLVTPRSVIHGPQTARVVGKDGEEIDVDEFGRILVLFHWDRKQKKSCRVRVAQVWAGKQWGGQFIPRIGMEAVVEFLEGDPDRPLVVGTVYNGDNKHPYDLPESKTQSGVKTDSSLGHSGYNEFMFDDKKDSETIRMQAQKDHEVKILNSETWEIGSKFQGGKGASRKTTLVQGSDSVTIQSGDQTIEVQAGDQTVTISGNLKTSADMGIKLTCGASSIEMTPTEIKITSGHVAISAPKIDWN
ncbi:type VI secretion system tip protein TssI/VgrG [uncultured Rhodoblastus sp.]|uniref:type VI secretion system Vgr family protein n=1 Tax=uncultured Rhodoblastus sp. TaxID=543037 RepID=UPI0025F667B9|nr:type VI secretion system tip protein TssI/VgrG [uncultured Rhodoblastus sp.]